MLKLRDNDCPFTVQYLSDSTDKRKQPKYSWRKQNKQIGILFIKPSILNMFFALKEKFQPYHSNGFEAG